MNFARPIRSLLVDQQTRNNRHPTLWNGLMIVQRTR